MASGTTMIISFKNYFDTYFKKYDDILFPLKSHLQFVSIDGNFWRVQNVWKLDETGNRIVEAQFTSLTPHIALSHSCWL